ncbi:PadR family transcriptional regulator [Staphylococcus sp. NRL 16/872]|uniref:PadR family transcriptional regulator n=1 Tax=Staphylococcus sp. NRL 16/872 TaxID=2930131 RepID=UPI001FB529DF|nr:MULTISPECIES: PadR family transcriptional regulator [unclassified Staphylococcus]MCJ1661321.1 PadR family transcriptional regulator [Staphylococcus sp. NRL 18/288]MCJ1667210.1 PadR family transcriptional regulator [Staphylococcus sp. NRL 19/737]WEN69693.1 PadR family transcriptional regulator [Staphylococcus sp. NRL 16/872]
MFRRHMQDMRQGMQRFEQFDGGKGPRGFEGFGGFGGRRGGGRDRFFKKGNLQFVILKMLEEESRHGYQIIKDLEERFKGFYSPSPGSVYPILQMLEDREFVSISKEGNKKIYTITDEGKQFLEENVDQNEFTQRLEKFKNVDFEQMKASREQLQEVFHGFMKASQSAMQDEEKKKELDALIEETKEKLEKIYK